VYYFDDQEAGSLIKLTEVVLQGDFDAALIAPTQIKEAAFFLEKCDERQIPYVQINSFLPSKNPQFLGYVGQDSIRSGRLGAKLVDMTTPNDSPVAILHLERDLANSEHMKAKEEGFKNYFSQSKRTVIVDWIPEIDNVVFIKKKIIELLAKYPKLSGLFVTTSRVNRIAAILLELECDDMCIVGFDLLKKNLACLERFKRMYLINQNPELQGYYGIMQLFDFLFKKNEVPLKRNIPLDVVVSENSLDYFSVVERDLTKINNPWVSNM